MPIDDKRRISQTHDGQGTPITSTPDGVKQRLDVDLGSPVASPVPVQAEQQIANAEIASIKLGGGGVWAGSGDMLFDKDNTTEISNDGTAPGGTIEVEFTHPILIARVGFRRGVTGPMSGCTTTVEAIDGSSFLVFSSPAGMLVDGIDSLNFSAILATKISVLFNGPALAPYWISEMSILKSIEVKATVVVPPITLTNTPPMPLFMQEQGQVVNAEVNFNVTGSWTGTPDMLFDKNVAIGMAGAGTITIMLNSPLLVGQVAMVGTLANVDITIIELNGAPTPIGVGVSGPSFTSGNFTPRLISGIIIVAHTPSEINEVMILKAKEVKTTPTAISNTPTTPLYTQSPQVLTLDEIDVAGSTITGGVITGGIANLFDQDISTGIQASVGPLVVTLKLKNTMLLSRIVMRKISTQPYYMVEPTIEVQTVNGVWVKVLDYVTPHDFTQYTGVDTGNFKDNKAPGPNRTFPVVMSPIPSIAVRLTVPGALSNIGEVTIWKTIETKSYVYNEVKEPLFVQDQKEMVSDEIDLINATWSYWNGVPELLFDKNPATNMNFNWGLITTGILTIPFKNPIPISRICGVLALSGASWQVEINTMNGWVSVPYSLLANGFDTGEFGTVMALGVRFTSHAGFTGGSGTFTELTIMKASPGAITNSPVKPLFTQEQGQVVLDEVDQVNSVINGVQTGTLADLFDKDQSTEVVIDGALGNGVVIALKSPLLIARLSAMVSQFGASFVRKDIKITITDVEYIDHVVYDGTSYGRPTPSYGVDSGNFKDQPNYPIVALPSSPINASVIKIETLTDDSGVYWSIGELSIFKVKEVKAFCYNEPSGPLYTEDDQHISSDEIWWPSFLGSGFYGDPKTLFDKNPSNYPLVLVAGGSLMFPFNTGHIISRVALTGMGSETISLSLIMGDGSILALPSISQGYYDSGNIAPTMCYGLFITLATGFVGISEMSVIKAHEVKISTDPAHPTQVQAEQQMTVDEINFTQSEIQIVNPSNLDMTNLVVLFKKNLWGTSITYQYNSSPGQTTLTIVFNTQQLISRVGFLYYLGVPVTLPIEITVFDIMGNPHTVLSKVPLPNETAGIDTGNFDPILANQVNITLPDASVMYLQEIGIFKVIETKTAMNRTFEDELIIFPAEAISPNSSIGPGGVVVPPLANLVGTGILIDKVKQNTVCVELTIVDAGNIGSMTLDVQWVYSPDNGTTWYYMSTYTVSEAWSTTNPSGFVVAGGIAFRQIAQPVGAYNKYIAIFIHNKGTGAVQVEGHIVKQR